MLRAAAAAADMRGFRRHAASSISASVDFLADFDYASAGAARRHA